MCPGLLSSSSLSNQIVPHLICTLFPIRTSSHLQLISHSYFIMFLTSFFHLFPIFFLESYLTSTSVLDLTSSHFYLISHLYLILFVPYLLLILLSHSYLISHLDFIPHIMCLEGTCLVPTKSRSTFSAYQHCSLLSYLRTCLIQLKILSALENSSYITLLSLTLMESHCTATLIIWEGSAAALKIEEERRQH